MRRGREGETPSIFEAILRVESQLGGDSGKRSSVGKVADCQYGLREFESRFFFAFKKRSSLIRYPGH